MKKTRLIHLKSSQPWNWSKNRELYLLPLHSPTPDGSAETGNPTVHSALRTTEDLNKEAKTNGKNHLTKGKHKIPKTNNNYNVGFMDVKETVKNNEINVKENNQVPSVLTPADPLASEVPRQ